VDEVRTALIKPGHILNTMFRHPRGDPQPRRSKVEAVKEALTAKFAS
jgi:hypothetical protein